MKAEGPELCPNVAPATSAVAASDKNAGEMPKRGRHLAVLSKSADWLVMQWLWRRHFLIKESLHW